MSSVDSSNLRDFLRVKDSEDGRKKLAGLTLDAVLSERRSTTHNRTLLDIIQNEGPSSYKSFVGHKDKKNWKTFKDKLLLKRSGSNTNWTSSVHIPTSDMPIHNPRRQVRFQTPPSTNPGEMQENFTKNAPNMIPEELSENVAPIECTRPQFGRHNSVRFQSSNSTGYRAETTLDHHIATDGREEPHITSHRLSVAFAEERSLSAREAAASQEAAEAEAAAAASVDENEDGEDVQEQTEMVEVESERQPLSLMDLLGETDGQMGLGGLMYGMEDDDFEDSEEDEENEETEENFEYNCSICMVRHKGSAFICGHTFCRLCSRELWVSRGNCTLCNDFIVEILDVF